MGRITIVEMILRWGRVGIRTRIPRICSQTRYRLRYGAWPKVTDAGLRGTWRNTLTFDTYLAKFLSWSPSGHAMLRELRINVGASWRCIDVGATLYKRHMQAFKPLNAMTPLPTVIYWRMRFRYLFGQILTLVLLNPDIPCICKQCRSRSVGFWRSQLIWICTVCH